MTPEERIQAHALIMEPVDDWLKSWGEVANAALPDTQIIENVVLLLIGGLVSWGISRYFYKKGSKDMESFYTLVPGSNSDGYHLSDRSILHCFGDFEMKNSMKEYQVYFPQMYALKPSVEISGDFSRIKSKHVSTSGFIIQVDPAPNDETLRFSYQSSGYPKSLDALKNS